MRTLKFMCFFMCFFFMVVVSLKADTEITKEAQRFLPKGIEVTKIKPNFKGFTNTEGALQKKDIFVCCVGQGKNSAHLRVFKKAGGNLVLIWKSDEIGYDFAGFEIRDINGDGRDEIVILRWQKKVPAVLCDIFYINQRGKLSKIVSDDPYRGTHSFAGSKIELLNLDKKKAVEIVVYSQDKLGINKVPSIYAWQRDRYVQASTKFPLFYNEVIAGYQHSLKLAVPKTKEAFILNLYMAEAYFYQNNLDEAIRIYETIVKTEWLENISKQNLSQAYYLLGQCYLKKKLKQKAVEAYQAGLKLDPINTDLKKALKKAK